MSWFTDLFSSGVKEVVSEIGDIIDDVVTSDEERLQAKERLTIIMNEFALKQAANANKFESEVTARHKVDMLSDSWLSKTIRPMVLIITMATIYLLIYLTVFSMLDESQIRVLEAWIPMVSGLFGTMVIFYFGSRGIEKINKMRMPKDAHN